MHAFLITSNDVVDLSAGLVEGEGRFADLRGKTFAIVEPESFARTNLDLSLMADFESFEALSEDESELFSHLIAPKTTEMKPKLAEALRAGYSHAERRGCFRGQSGPAHKAWVTMREWAYLVEREEFTHEVAVIFENGDSFKGKAVSRAHAEALVRKAKATHRRRFDVPVGKRLKARVLISDFGDKAPENSDPLSQSRTIFADFKKQMIADRAAQREGEG